MVLMSGTTGVNSNSGSGFRLAVAVTLLCAAGSQAGSIEGFVVVNRRLTKRSVTPSATVYQRGTAVPLGANTTDEDALSFERSRVVVYLEGKGPASKPLTAVLDQKDRRFSTDLVVIPAGSSVSFPNLDPIFHNVFSLSKSKSFDLGYYPKDQTKSVRFPEPGIVFVNCHLHSNMSAAIVVTPNAWAARVDRDGHFAIPDVPPGHYQVVAWHKAAGFFRQTLDVGPSATPTSVQFLIPLGAVGEAATARK